jgi:hypothetical protein
MIYAYITLQESNISVSGYIFHHVLNNFYLISGFMDFFHPPDDGQIPKTQWFCVLHTIVKTLQVLNYNEA